MTNEPLPPQNSPTPFAGDDLVHLDADLRSLDAALEMLGGADRAATDACFEDRMMQATLGSLHGVVPIMAQAAELGAMDRAAAPGDLEAVVFAGSVPALREAAGTVAVPTLRHVGQAERTPRQHVRVVQRAWWANQYVRLAAAVVLVAGLGITIRATLAPAGTTGSSGDRLAERVNRDMDLLFAAIENKPTTSDATDNAAPSDPDDLAKWLMEGASS